MTDWEQQQNEVDWVISCFIDFYLNNTRIQFPTDIRMRCYAMRDILSLDCFYDYVNHSVCLWVLNEGFNCDYVSWKQIFT